METVAGFNPSGQLKIYPGSPFITQALLREEARDKLKLFEMHPTDSKALAANIAQLKAGRQVAVARQDGFEGLKAFLPPPSRRALVLIDPSYEIKSDYQKVSGCIQDSLKRFSTGTYAVWYPVIPRPEAHELAAPPEDPGQPGRQALAARHAGDRPGGRPQRARRAGARARASRPAACSSSTRPTRSSPRWLPRCPRCCKCWAVGAAKARRWKPAAELGAARSAQVEKLCHH